MHILYLILAVCKALFSAYGVIWEKQKYNSYPRGL
jgi:hypothetical protein